MRNNSFRPSVARVPHPADAWKSMTLYMEHLDRSGPRRDDRIRSWPAGADAELEAELDQRKTDRCISKKILRNSQNYSYFT